MNQKNKTKSVLNFAGKELADKHLIRNIASGFCYIRSDVMIIDLAAELVDESETGAVAVIGKHDEILGLIPKKAIFNIVGMPFGRDLYKTKRVDSLMTPAKIFNKNENIFSIAEDIGDILKQPEETYFILKNDEGKFSGIFSSRDMMIFLSEMSKRDISTAKRIQSCIVSEEKSRESGKFNLEAVSKMAKGIGGDFYSIKNFSDSNWLISICDVSGNGLPASLMSVTLGGMEEIYDFSAGLSGYLKRLNSFICGTFEGQLFVTGIFLLLNEKTDELSIYNFGHSYLYLFRSGKIIKLSNKIGTIPMGISDNLDVAGSKIRLKENDTILMITDGISEQKNSEGREYGVDRMLSIIQNNIDESISALKSLVFKDVKNFRKEQTQSDDMTMIILRYSGDTC